MRDDESGLLEELGDDVAGYLETVEFAWSNSEPVGATAEVMLVFVISGVKKNETVSTPPCLMSGTTVSIIAPSRRCE